MRIAVIISNGISKAYPIESKHDQRKVESIYNSFESQLLMLSYKQAREIYDNDFKSIRKLPLTFKEQNLIKNAVSKLFSEMRLY